MPASSASVRPRSAYVGVSSNGRPWNVATTRPPSATPSSARGEASVRSSDPPSAPSRSVNVTRPSSISASLIRDGRSVTVPAPFAVGRSATPAIWPVKHPLRSDRGPDSETSDRSRSRKHVPSKA